MSYILQKKIANTFREQIMKKSFNHVSVSSLMRILDIRRQTFYDSFQDKYDLLEWQLNDILEETIDNNIDYLHWKEILKLFIYEIDAHKRYYYECLTVQTEVNVADIFATHLVVLLAHVLERQELISNKKAQDNMWILCLGISTTIIHNVTTPNPVDYELIVKQAINAIEYSFES
ncbi:dihydroxyacetone kinase transcriptional activator DhaS [Ligilactobacillus salivarius]|uniref:dihydroxyacetone kinase transcriptional activator DhaS n=1 Tax=Ligilactobacillus salivarius TaxID=1624 RepID=UPI0022DF3F2D|nr:dihydroxyacetone kinase transcriptional activator DhaS [Ligilactobacillus salivarius]